ncbi:MAG: DNA repair protein RadC [Candidatus Nanohaloarchaea archaeon]
MDYSIKDLPQSERPREKLEENGVSSLTEVELLSLILRTGSSGKNVNELSGEILNSYSLSSIADRPVEELQNFHGVSDVKAGQLKALSELGRRMQKEEREEIESFSDVKHRVEDMKFLDEEVLRVIVLNSGNQLLREEQIQGDVDSLSFSPRKILRPAVKENGSAIIIAHNHPSGRPEPTEKDIQTTQELVNAADSLGIDLLDHVIVGDKILSMKADSDRGLFEP